MTLSECVRILLVALKEILGSYCRCFSDASKAFDRINHGKHVHKMMREK